jgi:hypothetical protein
MNVQEVIESKEAQSLNEVLESKDAEIAALKSK